MMDSHEARGARHTTDAATHVNAACRPRTHAAQREAKPKRRERTQRAQSNPLRSFCRCAQSLKFRLVVSRQILQAFGIRLAEFREKISEVERLAAKGDAAVAARPLFLRPIP